MSLWGNRKKKNSGTKLFCFKGPLLSLSLSLLLILSLPYFSPAQILFLVLVHGGVVVVVSLSLYPPFFKLSLSRVSILLFSLCFFVSLSISRSICPLTIGYVSLSLVCVCLCLRLYRCFCVSLCLSLALSALSRSGTSLSCLCLFVFMFICVYVLFCICLCMCV